MQNPRISKLPIYMSPEEKQEWTAGGFPGGLMVKTLPSNAGGVGSVPGQSEGPTYFSAKRNQVKHKTGTIL